MEKEKESLVTKWRKALYHSVIDTDELYDTVMDLVFQRDKPFFFSKRLQKWKSEPMDSAKEKRFERLKEKSKLFELSQGYLCFRWSGAPPWVFSDRMTRENQLLPSVSKETIFRVVRPSQVGAILREAFLSMEDSGMTGYQNMYYHIIAVKKLLGITQRSILWFLKNHPYHQMVRTIATVETSISVFCPESPLEQFQLDVTDLKLPKIGSKVPYTISLCVVVDIFSRFCWATVLDSNQRAPILDFLRDTIFADGDIPKRLQTDNGPQMDNDVFRGFLMGYEVQHIMSDPYRPQANGFVEQKHHTIKTRLYAYFTQQREKDSSYTFARFRKELPCLLLQVIFSINHSIIRSICMAPINLHRGFQPGGDWSDRTSEWNIECDILDFSVPRNSTSDIFPKVQQSFIKKLQEKNQDKLQKQQKAFQMYDTVKIGMIYQGEKGYHQMVVVYPYTYDMVEHVVFTKGEGSLRPSEFVSKSMTVFSWSKTNFRVHDIDESGNLTKIYLRDFQNRPVIRKVKDGVSRESRYVSFFYPWMLLFYNGKER